MTSVTSLSTISSLPSQDYMLENLFWMGMTGLILLVIGVMLFQAQHNPRGPRGQQKVSEGGG